MIEESNQALCEEKDLSAQFKNQLECNKDIVLEKDQLIEKYKSDQHELNNDILLLTENIRKTEEHLERKTVELRQFDEKVNSIETKYEELNGKYLEEVNINTELRKDLENFKAQALEKRENLSKIQSNSEDTDDILKDYVSQIENCSSMIETQKLNIENLANESKQKSIHIEDQNLQLSRLEHENNMLLSSINELNN